MRIPVIVIYQGVNFTRDRKCKKTTKRSRNVGITTPCKILSKIILSASKRVGNKVFEINIVCTTETKVPCLNCWNNYPSSVSGYCCCYILWIRVTPSKSQISHSLVDYSIKELGRFNLITVNLWWFNKQELIVGCESHFFFISPESIPSSFT